MSAVVAQYLELGLIVVVVLAALVGVPTLIVVLILRAHRRRRPRLGPPYHDVTATPGGQLVHHSTCWCQRGNAQ